MYRRKFEELVHQHDMRTLISIFLPHQFVWIHKFDFSSLFHLNLGTTTSIVSHLPESLRTPVSEISQKAFACAKIQITKEGLFRKGKKNIVASQRYLLFGIQVSNFIVT